MKMIKKRSPDIFSGSSVKNMYSVKLKQTTHVYGGNLLCLKHHVRYFRVKTLNRT